MNIENKPESTNRCILELPLKYDKHEHTILNTMFRVANDMKNNLIGWYLNQYQEMVRTKKWRNNQAAIHQLYVDYAPGIKDLGKLKANISRTLSGIRQRVPGGRMMGRTALSTLMTICP